MKALVWAAVLNSLMSVPIMVGVIWAAGSRRLMGKLELPLHRRVWAGLGHDRGRGAGCPIFLRASLRS